MKLAIAISACLLLGITSCATPPVVDQSGEVARLKKVNAELRKSIDRMEIDLEHAVNKCKPVPKPSFYIKSKVGVA